MFDFEIKIYKKIFKIKMLTAQTVLCSLTVNAPTCRFYKEAK